MTRLRRSLRWLLLLAALAGWLALSLAPEQIGRAYQEQICPKPYQSVGLPLTELGNQPYTRMDGQVTEFTGGLYPNGSNQRPPEHAAAGIALAQQIQPLDSAGDPDPAGRIVLLSVGMSNTQMEFGRFASLLSNNPDINPRLFALNGALSGQTADRWLDPDAEAWQYLDLNLERYRLSAAQVQVAWIKLTLTDGGDFPAKALELQANLETIIHQLYARFPNLRLVYLSSRTYSYNYYRGLSPEPAAYETGFAVKWLIEKQLSGDPSLNYDPQRGPVTAPYLSWGPYLWADGSTPRLDGFTWLNADLTVDCTHPSEAGVAKIADLLYAFFSQDVTTQPWFLAAAQEPTPTLTLAAPPPDASPTVQPRPSLPAPTQTPGVSPASPTAEPPPASVTSTPAALPQPPETAASLAAALPWLMLLLGLAIGFGLGALLLSQRR